jgi:hypothetical protein
MSGERRRRSRHNTSGTTSWRTFIRIFGAEMSPYSVKVRSYFRYNAIPHQWVLRNAADFAAKTRRKDIP